MKLLQLTYRLFTWGALLLPGTAAFAIPSPDSLSTSSSESTDINAAQFRQFDVDESNLFLPDEVLETTELEQASNDVAPITPEEIHANEVLQKVRSENRFVKFLDSTALIDLPVGLVSESGKEDYAILIDSLVITPTHAYLTVYMCLPIPQSDRRLIFRGDNIRLSKSAGITGDARVFLVNDVENIRILGSQSTMTLLGGAENTSASWDCNGFKELHVSADINFSREWIQPLEGTGNITTHFETTVNDWDNMLMTIDMPPFQFASLPRTEFHTSNIVFDFSDYQTPESVHFPEGYDSPLFLGGDKSLWRGFYMEEFTVVMPPEFKQRGSSERISFSGHQLLIDNLGLTGSLAVENLFTIESGDMDGWGYSLDSLAIKIQANDLVGAGFKGQINIPVGDQSKPFAYNAIINSNGNYLFNVSTLEELSFEAWRAKLVLTQGSYLEVQTLNGDFVPKAVLNGSMDVTEPNSEVSLLGIKFEELSITTEAPYLDVKAFSLGSDKKRNEAKSFPVSIHSVGFNKKSPNNIALNFNLAVHLTGENDGSFYGDAGLELNAIRDQGSDKWEYDGIKLTSVAIDIDGGSFTLRGSIKLFEEDPIFGKGFNGNCAMTFQPGFELNGTVMFGKVDGYRYWYADAFVGFPTGIPFCGFLSMYGFGGGMYHNMEQVGFSNDPALSNGKTLSGVIYKPNHDVAYGFKATVQIGLTSSKETFNGDATFEISFNRGGGVRRISLLGNGYFLMDQELGDYEELAELVEKNCQSESAYDINIDGDHHYTSGLRPPGKDNALISGHFYQYYDFNNKVLHGEIEVYVDVWGALKGIGPDGLAGWSVMHFSPDEWFMYIGTPDRRIGLKVLGMMTMDGYLMTGDQIPGSPPPPARVGDILGMDLDYMRDENALGTGKGFAFGASFHFDTGNKKFLIFYGRFAMGLGFDIMMKNYGKQVTCKGESKPLGINGWYCNGQSYAYVEGEIGIKVKLLFKKKKIKILSISAAVVFQSKFPNPFWMRGVVGGRFSVLGGLVKGSCRFKVEIGDQCEIINGSVLEGLTVISDISPRAGSQDESVFVSPQAVFNFEIDKHFRMVDIDDEEKTFRIVLDHFQLEEENGTIHTANLSWNEDKTVAIYDNTEVLPPNTEFTAKVQVGFEEYVNNRWVKVKVNGEPVLEAQESKFKTGPAPDHIPASNVAYSYPQINQYNFYSHEYGNGFIKLKKGQSYLIENQDGWTQNARFVSADGDTVSVNYTYENNQVDYRIPLNLKDNKVYRLQLVNTPNNSEIQLDGNISAVVREVNFGENEESETQITQRKAEGSIHNYQETTIFENTFRTSYYKTFADKINGMDISNGWRLPDTRGYSIHILGNNVYSNEYFDLGEMEGLHGELPLVSLEAKLEGNYFYEKKVFPMVYDDYENLTVPPARITRSDAYGLPPTKAVFIRQAPYAPATLTDAAFETGASSTTNAASFQYELPYYMKQDYRELQTKTASYCTFRGGEFTPRRLLILESPFPVVTSGRYTMQIRYTIPGIREETTRKDINIINPY